MYGGTGEGRGGVRFVFVVWYGRNKLRPSRRWIVARGAAVGRHAPRAARVHCVPGREGRYGRAERVVTAGSGGSLRAERGWL